MKLLIDIASGGQHVCAVLDDGDVRCWGRNSRGQLGLGTTDDLGDDTDETPATVSPVGGRVVDAADQQFLQAVPVEVHENGVKQGAWVEVLVDEPAGPWLQHHNLRRRPQRVNRTCGDERSFWPADLADPPPAELG